MFNILIGKVVYLVHWVYREVAGGGRVNQNGVIVLYDIWSGQTSEKSNGSNQKCQRMNCTDSVSELPICELVAVNSNIRPCFGINIVILYLRSEIEGGKEGKGV